MPWHWRGAVAFVVVMALLCLPGLCLLARWAGWNACAA